MNAQSESIEGSLVSIIRHWKNQPLVMPFLLVAVVFVFLLIIIQGHMEDAVKVHIAYAFLIFCLLALGITIWVLVRKRFALYNANEKLLQELYNKIHTVKESLQSTKISFGQAFEDISGKPVSQNVRDNVNNLHILADLLKDAGDDYERHFDDGLKIYLAKYYYKLNQLERAFLWIEKVNNKDGDDYNFTRGVILYKMGQREKSREFFDKSSNYYMSKLHRYISFVRDSAPKKDLEEAINQMKPNNPLYSDVYAQMNYAFALYFLATHYPPEGKKIDIEKLLKNKEVLEQIIYNSGHWLAYYNEACVHSTLASVEYPGMTAKEYKYKIICNLRKALDKTPEWVDLMRLICADPDLDWFRENASTEYYDLIGNYFHRKYQSSSNGYHEQCSCPEPVSDFES